MTFGSRTRSRILVAALAASSLAAPLAAQVSLENAAATSAAAQPRVSAEPSAETTGTALRQFAPASDRGEHRIDYAHWDEALAWFVIPMGPSIREGAPRVEPRTGTRRIYGHESRYRLEGNRVAFSFITPDIRQSLSDYRADLERVGSELDLTALPRNEQLAYWLNLHNVAVIEALALEYPLSDPAEREFGTNSASLDDAKLVTVAGVALSPRDIRTRIVFPNWRDPKVMYGFWRGVIGGPSIQRLAFNGNNVDTLLAISAEEFVNSLRGVESYNGSLRVSRIYQEAMQFYFDNDFAELRTHFAQFAREDVKELIFETENTDYNKVDNDLADMALGERDPAVAFLASIDCGGAGCALIGADVGNAVPVRSRPNLAIQRIVIERAEKMRRANDRGIRTGMVIFGDGRYAEGEGPREVE
jgi:hypothetical protein